MSNSIEVVSGLQRADITELAREMLHNRRPGFQIDGVQEYEELELVFDALLKGVPDEARDACRFNDALYSSTTFDHPDGLRRGLPAHSDGENLYGMAVHLNISGKVPVELSYTSGDAGSYRISTDAPGYQRGETVPGRLTVFSEGDLRGILQRLSPNLKPHQTQHFFHREALAADEKNLWARFTRDTRSSVELEDLRRIERIGRRSLAEAQGHRIAMQDKALPNPPYRQQPGQQQGQLQQPVSTNNPESNIDRATRLGLIDERQRAAMGILEELEPADLTPENIAKHWPVTDGPPPDLSRIKEIAQAGHWTIMTNPDMRNRIDVHHSVRGRGQPSGPTARGMLGQLPKSIGDHKSMPRPGLESPGDTGLSL